VFEGLHNLESFARLCFSEAYRIGSKESPQPMDLWAPAESYFDGKTTFITHSHIETTLRMRLVTNTTLNPNKNKS